MIPIIAAIAMTPTGTLKGNVDIGPISPVMRQGIHEKVPPEMYAHLQVHIMKFPATTGAMRPHFLIMVKNLGLDSKGDFTLKLPEGQYRVEVARDKPQKVGRLPAQTVNIVAGKTVKLELHVDTGIR